MSVYWLFCFIMIYLDGSLLYLMLSWNVLLALLPLIFINQSERRLMIGKPGSSILWMILWLLFFPNSVYMVTDFIHISNHGYMRLVDTAQGYRAYEYSTDILIWAKLLIIGIGFIFALLDGLESLYVFEQNLKNLTSKMISFGSILLVSLLSGIGVYIGRFLRFNSWDVFLNPDQLMKEMALAVDGFTVRFVLIFALFIIASYVLYKIFRQMIHSHVSATYSDIVASPDKGENQNRRAN